MHPAREISLVGVIFPERGSLGGTPTPFARIIHHEEARVNRSYSSLTQPKLAFITTRVYLPI
jgi:hypothetical protein